MSNLTSLTDANRHTTAFAYDIYNRVSAVIIRPE
jgi:YD repeat-containing protein